MFTQTAGIGSFERRDYIMHPPEAKKQAEIYDKIMAWEREIEEQEKMTALDQRPLISNPMKITIIKNIAYGGIKDYIETHEAIMDYDADAEAYTPRH